MQNLDEQLTTNSKSIERAKKRRKSTITAIVLIFMLTYMVYLFHSLIPMGLELLPWYEQALYIGVVYGLPLLGMLLSLGLAALIAWIWKKDVTYKQRMYKHFRVVYLVFITLNFFFILMAQIGISNDPNSVFDSHDFQEIAAYQGDLSDLKTGKFYTDQYTFERTEDYQVEFDPTTGKSRTYNIGWINDAEYYLVDPTNEFGIDSLFIKITNNTATYYEFYISFDKKEAIYGKMFKVKE